MLMAGVSTGQNITNLIPAVQYQIKKFLLLETATARNAGWSQGLENVLADRRIEVEKIDLSGIDSDIIEIKKKLSGFIDSYDAPVIWNLGGGQKPQQIALWEVFRKRTASKQPADEVCYANQDDRQNSSLEIWKLDENGELSRDFTSIDVDLSCQEIFKVFGYVIKSSPQLIYKKTLSETLFEETKDLLAYQDFRKYLFKLAGKLTREIENETPLKIGEIKALLTGKKDSIDAAIKQKLSDISPKNFEQEQNQKTLAQLIRGFIFGSNSSSGQLYRWLSSPVETEKFDCAEELKSLLNLESNEISVNPQILESICQGISKTSIYFEKIVVRRVRKILLEKNHNINEAYANLEIAPVNNPETVAAEYDVLCVRNNGTITALDAKTFDFKNKDIDARLYNLERGSGFYRTFSAVLPLDYEDADQDFYPNILVNLAYELRKKRLPFYVISDSVADKSFWLKKNGAEVEKSKIRSSDAEWIECPVLDNSFQ